MVDVDHDFMPSCFLSLQKSRFQLGEAWVNDKRTDLEKVNRQCIEKFVCDKHGILRWVSWDVRYRVVEMEFDIAF